MDGYEVLSADGETIGHVVATTGSCIVVEHGTLRKTRNALPVAFVETDAEARVIRTTLAKTFVHDSPKVSETDVDETEVGRYYGLAADDPAPTTEGYGVTDPGDPGRGAAQDAAAAGVPAAEEQRAHTRAGSAPGQGDLDTSSSPGLTGGDRFRDA